jgi:hypothetical protein
MRIGKTPPCSAEKKASAGPVAEQDAKEADLAATFGVQIFFHKACGDEGGVETTRFFLEETKEGGIPEMAKAIIRHEKVVDTYFIQEKFYQGYPLPRVWQDFLLTVACTNHTSIFTQDSKNNVDILLDTYPLDYRSEKITSFSSLIAAFESLMGGKLELSEDDEGVFDIGFPITKTIALFL